MFKIKDSWAVDFRFQSFFMTILIMVFSLYCVDLIPISEGQGWDGAVYYQLIIDWSNGRLGVADIPYRLMRAGAFLPQVIFYSFVGSEAAPGLVEMSRFIAVFWAGLGGWFAVLACNRLKRIESKKNKLVALMLLLCYLLSFCVFVMPAFYPLLTDHFALFISGFSLWLWTFRGYGRFFIKIWGLGLLAVWGMFIMPLVSVVPLVLLVFPLNAKENIISRLLKKINKLYFFLIVGLITIIGAIYWVSFTLQIPNEILLARHNGTAPALIPLKAYSAIITAIFLSWSIGLFIICGLRLSAKFSWLGLIVSILAVMLPLLVIFSVSNWSTGSGGPNLILNLGIQSLQAPGIQLAAIFSYFGPLGLLGAVAVTFIIIKPEYKNLDAIAFLGAFFFMFLSAGNEPRQFIAALPIILFISIFFFEKKPMVGLISVLFSVFLLLIGWPIADNITQGVNAGADFMDYRWQAYFGRSGPWMSLESIILFFSIAIIYIITLWLIIQICKNHLNLLEKRCPIFWHGFSIKK